VGDISGYFSRAGGVVSYEVGNKRHDQNMFVMETIIYITSNTAKKAVFGLLRGWEEISGLQ